MSNSVFLERLGMDIKHNRSSDKMHKKFVMNRVIVGLKEKGMNYCCKLA